MTLAMNKQFAVKQKTNRASNISSIKRFVLFIEFTVLASYVINVYELIRSSRLGIFDISTADDGIIPRDFQVFFYYFHFHFYF